MTNRFCTIILSAFLLVLSTIVSYSSEFGNIFGGGDVEKQSRLASSTALKAIEDVIAGIRARELQENDGSDNLESAVSQLRQASVLMNDILAGKFGDFPDSDFSNDAILALLGSVEFVNSRFELKAPRTFRELYTNFANATNQVADYIEKNSGIVDEPIFPILAPILSDYFSYGAITTQIARSLRT